MHAACPPSQRWPMAAAVGILCLHAALCLNAARNLSPTWDEIVYPAAGAAQWRTHALVLNTEHAFLSKLICAAPLMLRGVPVPIGDPAYRTDEHRFGFHYVYRNTVAARQIVFLSRIPAVIFSVLTAVLLFFWMRALWGAWGGVLTLFSYSMAPIILSRASTALLEMPMYFFIVAALYAHVRWQRTGRWTFLGATGVLMALAFLCKLPSLPLLPCFLILEFWPERPLLRGLGAALLLIGSTAATIALSYLPWSNAWAGFGATLHNLFVFDTIVPYEWHGRLLDQAPSFLSWAAWLIKAPLAVVLLGAWGLWEWRRTGEHQDVLRHLLVFIAVTFGSVLFFRQAVTTVQFSAAYLALAAATAPLARTLRKSKWRGVALWGLCAVAGIQIFRIQPNNFAYFNSLVGGSRNGWRWLGDSDQDWGQSLPAMAAYWKRLGSPPLLLAYSGAGDPAAYGLQYQDLLSPALVTRDSRGERLSATSGPLYLFVSTKVLQTEPSMSWLLHHLTPAAMPDPCFFVYDVGGNAEALRWAASLYAVTRRQDEARWALARARQRSPENAWDRAMEALLKSHS